VPFANIGLFARNIGTLSTVMDFELRVPGNLTNDRSFFRPLDMEGKASPRYRYGISLALIKLMPESTVLDAVTIHGKKTKIADWADGEVVMACCRSIRFKGGSGGVDGGKS